MKEYTYLVFVFSEYHLLTKSVHFRTQGSEPASSGVTVYWEGEAYLPNGRINETVRSQLNQIGQLERISSGMNVCVVYGANDCDYIQADGGSIRSDSPITLGTSVEEKDINPLVGFKILDELARRKLDTGGKPILPAKKKAVIQ
jgi:hypothetical protein